MHEMINQTDKLRGLSLFVGTGQCNANCAHCAGKIHRKYAPRQDGILDENLINKILRSSYAKGARSLSISSSGEPTLSPKSVTKALELIDSCRKEGMDYSQINLYTNGIRIGSDLRFCQRHLNHWKQMGLKAMYVTVHNVDEKKNAGLYGIDNYPPLKKVISSIHEFGFLMRANLVLSKRTVHTSKSFISTVSYLRQIGADCISAWPIRNALDQVDLKLAPLEKELDKMQNWIYANPDCRTRLLREKDRERYTTGEKLTLFPDGRLLNTWCS